MRTKHVKPKNVRLSLFEDCYGAVFDSSEIVKTVVWQVTGDISIEQAKAKVALVPSHLTLG
jgi:hypothetical protein